MMPLKKIVLFIILAFALIRLVVWGLIGSCTALAPDEEGYFQVFKYINNSREVRPTNVWTNTPEWILSVFFAPARFFSFIGLAEFQAFRLQSILLAMGAIIVMIFSLRNLGIYDRFKSLDKNNRAMLLIFLAISSLMPSNIFWTTLGLREPFIYISLALIFFSFSDFINSKYLVSPWILIYWTGLIVLGYTKFYLFIIVCISVFVSLTILKTNRIFTKLLITLIVTLATTPMFSSQFTEINWPTIKISSVRLTFDYLPNFNTPKLPSMTYSQLIGCRDSSKAGPLLIFGLAVVETLLPQRTEIASSQLPVDEPSATALRNDENLRGELNLFNLPIGLLNFLIFPVSILDSGLFGLLGILEVIFWLPLYYLLVMQVWRSRRDIRNNPILLVCLSFILIFVTFSALSEVNFGTALRHRSVLLVPMALVALSSWRNKPSKADT